MNNENKIVELKKQKCIEGILFTYKMLKDYHPKIYPTCCEMKVDNNKIYEAYLLCWLFIDSVHRIRELLQAMPGLNKKNNDLVNFIKKTAIIEEYRHYIQHLRNELNNNHDDNYPVWGSLSWVDPINNKVSHMLIMTTVTEPRTYSGCVYDKLNNKWISKICLGLKDNSLNIDIIYNDLEEYMKIFLEWIKSSDIKINELFENPIIIDISF